MRISIEAAQEGFSLNVDGRRVIAHSRRSPCVEIGVAESVVRQTRGGSKLHRRRVVRSSLKSFRIVENDGDRACIDFEGKLRVLFRLEAGRLRITFTDYDATKANHFRMRFAAWSDESVYGCGERYTHLDLKGSRIPLWVEEPCIGRGGGFFAFLAKFVSEGFGNRRSGHFPMPLFMSTKNYWCVVDTEAYTVFDFRRRASTLVYSWGIPGEIVMGFAADPPSMLADMTSMLGRQPLPPEWVFDGAWLGVQGGVEESRRKVEAALAAGAKVGAVWAPDWCGYRVTNSGREAMWDWSRDGGLYPDLPREIARWREKGIRFLGYINPFLSIDGILYAEASSLGCCVKNPSGGDYLLSICGFPAAMLDLSNPAAVSWIKEVVKREMLAPGMDGWMADFGEYLPVDAVLFSGEDASLAHNRWPLLWAKANREAVEESGCSRDTVFFMRSGWLGSARQVPAFWAGARLVDFSLEEGLPSVVPAAISLGLSGIGFWHSDAGGSTGTAWKRRSGECLERWMEISAFTPIFRSHEGSRPEANAQFYSDAGTLRLFARMTEVFAALKPYHIAAAKDYVERGLPPIRHPWIHYGDDPAVHRLEYQYLYGRDLMVAPALSRGASLTELYLPEDEWVHIWTSRCFRGGRVTIDSPSGCPAVFYRASSPFAELFDAIRRTVCRA